MSVRPVAAVFAGIEVAGDQTRMRLAFGRAARTVVARRHASGERGQVVLGVGEELAVGERVGAGRLVAGGVGRRVVVTRSETQEVLGSFEGAAFFDLAALDVGDRAASNADASAEVGLGPASLSACARYRFTVNHGPQSDRPMRSNAHIGYLTIRPRHKSIVAPERPST